jgi:hypothetical protein
MAIRFDIREDTPYFLLKPPTLDSIPIQLKKQCRAQRFVFLLNMEIQKSVRDKVKVFLLPHDCFFRVIFFVEGDSKFSGSRFNSRSCWNSYKVNW